MCYSGRLYMYLASMPNDATGLPIPHQNRLLLVGLIEHYNMFSVYVLSIITCSLFMYA